MGEPLAGTALLAPPGRRSRSPQAVSALRVTILSQAKLAAVRGRRATVVTADRMLQARVEGAGALSLSPSWLLDQL